MLQVGQRKSLQEELLAGSLGLVLDPHACITITIPRMRPVALSICPNFKENSWPCIDFLATNYSMSWFITISRSKWRSVLVLETR